MIRHHATQLLAFLQVEWIQLFADSTSSSVPVNQVVRGCGPSDKLGQPLYLHIYDVQPSLLPVASWFLAHWCCISFAWPGNNQHLETLLIVLKFRLCCRIINLRRTEPRQRNIFALQIPLMQQVIYAPVDTANTHV